MFFQDKIFLQDQPTLPAFFLVGIISLCTIYLELEPPVHIYSVDEVSIFRHQLKSHR